MTRFPLQSAPQWVEEFGSPLYVYDAQTISAQYQRIANAFDPNISLGIHYACKALNNINVLKLLRSLNTISAGRSSKARSCSFMCALFKGA